MNTLRQIDIFSYTDPSLYLRDQWLLKKKKNGNFSIRAWAFNLGIKSHSQLHQMLYAKRSIPKKYIPCLIKNLALTKKESDYFELLLDIQQAKTNEEKSFHLDKIKAIPRKDKIVFEEIEHYEMIKNPLHFFLLEMIELENQILPIEKIKEQLCFPYSLAEIKRALETLMRLGLITEFSPGKYQKTENHFYTKNDIPSMAIREHHKEMANLSKIAIDTQDVSEREFNATTFNIDPADLPRAKELIREFREKFMSELSQTPQKNKSTYQFNMNFFAVTKKRDSK